jgi:hypothetical protein
MLPYCPTAVADLGEGAIAPPFENLLHKKIYVVGSQVCLIRHVYAMYVIVFHRKLIS